MPPQLAGELGAWMAVVEGLANVQPLCSELRSFTPQPAATFACLKKSAGIGRRSRHVKLIGRSPLCDT